MKTCIIENCGCAADAGRRYCHKHFLERKSKQRAERKALGLKVRTTYTNTCMLCGCCFTSTRKTSKYCKSCYEKMQKFGNSCTNNYVYNKKDYKQSVWQHRQIVEKLLGRKLNTNEVVHHLDGNPKNNELTNLIVLSRQKHGALHRFLDIQGVILQECKNENTENCWNNLIVPITTTWLETAGVKVIKIWEIGQSAAEPLSNEEGSETMHGTSRTDEDIVQTTTSKIGLRE